MSFLPLQYDTQYITTDGKIVGPFDPRRSIYFGYKTHFFAYVDLEIRGWVAETGKRAYDGYVGDIVSKYPALSYDEMYKELMG